jgi:hypothetical protein
MLTPFPRSVRAAEKIFSVERYRWRRAELDCVFHPEAFRQTQFHICLPVYRFFPQQEEQSPLRLNPQSNLA